MNPPAPPPQQPPLPPPAAAFFQSHLPNPPPRPPPPPPSLSTALSNLTSHLHLSATILRSLPTASVTDTTSPILLPCPFNPNHRLPPSSLFSHYLNCPSPLSLLHTFHYPLTLHSSTTSTTSTSLPSITTTSSDLPVPLENYIGYNGPANNFFYQNCPGPVTPSVQSPPLLNLPRVLYIECADFDEESERGKPTGFSVDFIRFLPSEIWAIQTEIEAWGGGFPAAYSSRTLRAILRLRDCKLLHLYDWIISTFPRYGVIIDSAIRDHVVLLVRLCLKVIVREAFQLVGTKFSDGSLKTADNVLSGFSNRSFECPVLMKVMMWLAFQFSILFGEANAKIFVINLLKECILDSALHASLFPLEQKDAELSDLEKAEAGNLKGETVENSMIFISQVAAAVAALHERSFIEEKIRVLRNPRPLSAYQRNMDHAYVSKIADEERKKRPDYRPTVEYDGFPWQRSSNQDTNTLKTREELLAEERDYKRRRMSYRGKKLKRNTIEVMRGIIEEYMEDIKQAGGIGGMSKDVEDTKSLGSENLNTHASSSGVSGSRRSSEMPEENRGQSLDYRKGIHHERNFQNGGDYSREQMHCREKQDYVEASSRRSPKRRSESRVLSYQKRNRDDREHERELNNHHRRDRDEHERSNSLKREGYEHNWDYGDRRKSKRDSARRERDEDKRRTRKTSRSRSSHPELHEFEDRYDPAESHDIYS